MTSQENRGILQQPNELSVPLVAPYEQWLAQQIQQGTLSAERCAPLEQRKALLADWLRHLVTTGTLTPNGPLPAYAALGKAFALSTDQVAGVVRQLRQNQVLRKRRPRSDAGQSQWNNRDRYCLQWIGEQRACRYDQLQRLLARESVGEPQHPSQLSLSRTTQIIKRWQQAHLVTYRKIYVHQPGWLWLTHKGLHFADLEYRTGIPAESSLTHLYYINEVRLLLEAQEQHEELTWISERALQHELEGIRRRKHALIHIPDAVAIIGKQTIDLEIELTRKPQRAIERTMHGNWGGQSSTHALRYYVSHQAQATVNAAWKQIVQAYSSQGMRPWVEIVALDEVFKRPE